MTQLFLVRHGQTVGNVQRVWQGWTEGELTPNDQSHLDGLVGEAQKYSSRFKRGESKAHRAGGI